MTSCSLFASALVSQVSGAVPTFSYHTNNHNSDYFGIQTTYMNGQSTCYQTDATPRFTPVIQNTASGYSVDCQFVTQGNAYTGIYCPSALVTSIPNGVLTVSYINLSQGQPTPIPFLATFGPSPAPRAVTTTTVVVATSTATATYTVSPGFASTATVYAAGATQTSTSTIIVTKSRTTTNTNYVSSCAAPSVASSSSSSAQASSSAAPTASTASFSNVSALPTPSGITNKCPGDDDKLVYTSAGTFQIICSYDRDGTTTGQFQPGNGLLGCINLCANTQTCVWSTYYNAQDVCYLKFGSGMLNYNTAAWGARLLPASSSSSPVPSTSNAIRSSVSSQVPTSSPMPSSSAAPPAPSPSSSSPSSSSPASGSSSSASSSSLPAASSLPSPSSSPTPSPSASSSRASSSAAASSTSTSGLACPGSDGKTYTVGTKIFRITCEYDRDGTTTGLFQTGNGLTGCITLCAQTDGCVWSTYFADRDACHLKFGDGIPNYNTAASGAKWLNPPASSLSAAASATPGVALGCPSSDGSTYTSECGATYAIECYSDRYGDDIPGGTSYTTNLDDCIANCDNTDDCVHVSYIPGSPGPCYKKSSIAAVRQNDNVFGARQLTQCRASIKLKLHRKRVVRDPTMPQKKPIQKRGVYGPDFTYTQGSTTTTQTTTSTVVRYTSVTTTPSNRGTTTTTVYTIAATTDTVTSGATVTQTQQTTVTTCPATTRPAVL